MESTKVFSVIVPAYNAEKTLLRTLASFISSADYIYEVIVVDDHSTDATALIPQKLKSLLPIKTISNQGAQGPGPSRKTGLLAAQGEWIAFVDADDCLTPSALRYVYQEIQSHMPSVLILRTMTMFYEFGSFNIEHITYNGNSCGGTYYNRQYLIDNQLFPHDTLKMCEDEFFNRKINSFMTHYDHCTRKVYSYDYPTYEVHHDDDYTSLALGDWSKYAIHYALLCQQYLVDTYTTYANISNDDWIEEEWLNNFLFCYYIYNCLFYNNEDNMQELLDRCQDLFNAVLYYEKTFSKSRTAIVDYVNDNKYIIPELLNGAKVSTGVEDDIVPFDLASFVRKA